VISHPLAGIRVRGGTWVACRACGGADESELCIVEARTGAVYRVDRAALGA